MVVLPAGASPGVTCPADDGVPVVVDGTGGTRLLGTAVNRDVDDDPPGWAADAVARRRALRGLREQASADAADGVVGVRFEVVDDGRAVRATGTLVRRRRVGAGRAADEPFTTHLSPADADLALEAGLKPRRLVVPAVRLALHEPDDAWPEPDLFHGTTFDVLVRRARAVLDDVWRSAGRRRGAATVVVGDVVVSSARITCTGRVGHDVELVATGVSSVLAGAVDRSEPARDVADRLGRYVVPVGAR